MRIEKVFVAAIALAFRLMSTASAEPIHRHAVKEHDVFKISI